MLHWKIDFYRRLLRRCVKPHPDKLRPFFTAMLLAFISPPLMFAGQSSRLLIDDTTYYFHGGRNKTGAKNLMAFHEIWQERTNAVYTELNVKKPVSFFIHIAETAQVFSRLTNKNWYVAALYSPANDSFYFQNISSLIKQNTLYKTAAHEICHQALFTERRQLQTRHAHQAPNQITDQVPNYAMYYAADESFCLAYAPVLAAQNTPVSSAKSLFRKFKEFEDFQSHLNKLIPGGRRKDIYLAYQMAQTWGNYLIKTAGLQKAFRLTAENNAAEMNSYYLNFLKSLR